MMRTATPFRKPVITESETKRSTEPSRNNPASSWITPTSRTSAASAAIRWSAAKSTSSAPAARDSAAVVDTFMKTEPVNRAAAGTATMSV